MIIVCISDLFVISHQSDNLDTPCGNITLHLGGILTSEMLTEVMLHNVTHGHSISRYHRESDTCLASVKNLF